MGLQPIKIFRNKLYKFVLQKTSDKKLLFKIVYYNIYVSYKK